MKISIIDNTKICSKCKEVKSLDNFYFCNSRGKTSPYTSLCKPCISVQSKEVKIRGRKPCPICGNKMNRLSLSCRKCFFKNPEWIQKMKEVSGKQIKRINLCVDCNARIHLRSERCIKCRSKGEKNARWKGGVVSLKTKIRLLFEYRQWRSDVFTRDNFTCMECGYSGNKLQAHHIIPLNILIQKNEITKIENAIDCNELWNINNGLTLCINCHKNLHKQKGYKNEHNFA